MALLTRRFNKMFKNWPIFSKNRKKEFRQRRGIKKSYYNLFECKKSGHIKVDCPKLKNDSRKDKKNCKEKFEKFKKAFAAQGESDIDTFDDKSSDHEVSNLCLLAKEEEISEVHCESNSFDEL